MKSLYFLTSLQACLSVYLIVIFIISNKLYLNTAQGIICFSTDQVQQNIEKFVDFALQIVRSY